jgi:hypothetical protein
MVGTLILGSALDDSALSEGLYSSTSNKNELGWVLILVFVLIYDGYYSKLRVCADV